MRNGYLLTADMHGIRQISVVLPNWEVFESVFEKSFLKSFLSSVRPILRDICAKFRLHNPLCAFPLTQISHKL